MKNRIIVVATLIFAFALGACSAQVARADQEWPLKIWRQNENGVVSTYVIVDDDTGVNYVVVCAQNFGNAQTIAITPRLKAGEGIYTSKS